MPYATENAIENSHIRVGKKGPMNETVITFFNRLRSYQIF